LLKSIKKKLKVIRVKVKERQGASLTWLTWFVGLDLCSNQFLGNDLLNIKIITHIKSGQNWHKINNHF